MTTQEQVVVAAELSTDSPDGRLIEPKTTAMSCELEAAGIDAKPGTLVADAGYRNVPQIDAVERGDTEVLVATEGSTRPRRGGPRKARDKRPEGRYLRMAKALGTPRGQQLYRRRQQMVEPVFAQTKVTRRADRFQRRGLSACRSEWRLIAATHNLLKLLRHGLAGAG
jgi:Transposase DDE domain